MIPFSLLHAIDQQIRGMALPVRRHNHLPQLQPLLQSLLHTIDQQIRGMALPVRRHNHLPQLMPSQRSYSLCYTP